MTVPVQLTFTASIANGVTQVFPYGFKITSEDDIRVFLDGVEITTGFTVSGVGDELGGAILFAVAPANGVNVLRALSPIFKRDTDYQQFGDWNALVVNNDFDRLWLALQSIQQNFTRSLKLPIDTATDQVLSAGAAARIGKLVSFDSSGNMTLVVPADLSTTTVSAFMATVLDDSTPAEARATLGVETHLAASKTTPVDADELALADSSASFGLKRLTWANLKATLATVFARPSQTGKAGASLVTDGTNESWGSSIASSASVPSTSGASIDFTGIPSWAKRLTINFIGVSMTGAANLSIRLGDSGGLEATGYSGSTSYIGTSNFCNSTQNSTGFDVYSSAAANVMHGSVTISLSDPSSNTWCASGVISYSNAPLSALCSGSKSLSAALDRLSVIASTAFDLGSISLMWE